jgi:hypothetical protein
VFLLNLLCSLRAKLRHIDLRSLVVLEVLEGLATELLQIPILWADYALFRRESASCGTQQVLVHLYVLNARVHCFQLHPLVLSELFDIHPMVVFDEND